MKTRWGLALLGLALLPACEYGKLLRPSVVRQLDPDLARLVNFFPAVDNPNEAIIARLPGHGGLRHAEHGPDGVMRVAVRAPKGQMIWQPSLIVVPRGGVLELDITNEDEALHAALVAGNGDKQMLSLPPRTRGVVRVHLDAPGLHTFSCPIANHGTRGMLGLILVKGDVPGEARLERPAMPRP